MSAPKQVSVQSRNPRKSIANRDPDRHYVLVENEQVDSYLDLASLANPQEDRYKEESRDRKETGRKGEHRKNERADAGAIGFGPKLRKSGLSSAHFSGWGEQKQISRCALNDK